MIDLNKFKNLDYDAFKKLASDDSLSANEKIGFPDQYRKGFEKIILADIITKLNLGSVKDKCIIDIGCGCSPLTDELITFAIDNRDDLFLLDSKEMLDQINTSPEKIHMYSGYFPEMPDFIGENKNNADAVLIYSVAHYIFYHQDIFKFLDSAVSLLKEGGKLLLGDIPNATKRQRFFETNTGIRFHQHYTNSKTLPDISQMQSEPAIDDAIIFAILHRYRIQGYETYLLAQPDVLPMANRREDILICKW